MPHAAKYIAQKGKGNMAPGLRVMWQGTKTVSPCHQEDKCQRAWHSALD